MAGPTTLTEKKRLRRRFCFVFCAALVFYGCDTLPSAHSYQPPISTDDELSERLEALRVSHRQPAMAAAIVRGGETLASAAVGTTVFGGSQAVEKDDRFHIGSVTKSVTAVLIATLVEEGTLRYETTLEEALPEVAMRDEYRNVTIHDLMLNRAGVIAFQRTDLENPAHVEMLTVTVPHATTDPREQREMVASYALAQEPEYEPGSRSVYSNVGWAILGFIAETAVGVPYEQVVEERIFRPLSMEGARFGGWPASESDPLQPRGHYAGEGDPRPQPLDDPYVLPPWMNPSGGIHCTIDDFARYAGEHLAGLQGEGRLLTQSSYERIHSIQGSERARVMYQGANSRRVITLGYGWAVVSIDDAMLSAADGSGGTFYARLVVLPALDIAFAGFTNSGDGEAALSEAIRELTGLPWR